MAGFEVSTEGERLRIEGRKRIEAWGPRQFSARLHEVLRHVTVGGGGSMGG